MYIKDFGQLPIGARFKIFDCRSIAVYTKIANEYTVGIEGYPTKNMHSEIGQLWACKLEDPVLVLTDKEVVEASEVERAVQIGELFLKDVLVKNGTLYFSVQFLRMRPEQVSAGLHVWK